MRYAIYLTPPHASPLEVAASRWLGRSAFGGAPDTHTHTGTQFGKGAPAVARAEVPARYGFHATLRAPFRLRAGVDEAALLSRFKDAYGGAGVRVPLKVSALRQFVALTAEEEARATLAEVEERALHTFEPLRRPLSEDERARRRPDELDEHGRALLDTWGYPHVLDRFTFHMTLSGPVAGDVGPVAAAANTHFAEFLHRPLPLVHAVFREAEPGGPFTVLATEEAV